MDEGYELRCGRGTRAGVFATRRFARDALVMAGTIEKVLDKPLVDAEQVGEHIYVRHGGLIGKVNHSCDPNTGIRLNGDGAHDFVARRCIEPGEEITFDLAMRNYDIRPKSKLCTCGTSGCRGRITGWRDLSPEKKIEYRNFAAPYLIALDHKYAC